MQKSILSDAKINPKIVQTDRGGEFDAEFDDFLKTNGITHIKN